MTNKPNFEASPDVEVCADFLRHNKSRGLIDYAQIGRATNRDVAGRDRHILASARRILEREGIIFVTETGKGLRLATASQVAKLSTEAPILKTRRIAKTAKKRQASVNVQALSDEERAAFYVGRAVLGAIGLAASKAFTNRIAKEGEKADGVLPIQKTIEMFSKLRPRRSKELQ